MVLLYQRLANTVVVLLSSQTISLNFLLFSEALDLFLETKKFKKVKSSKKAEYVASVKTWIGELAAEYKKPREGRGNF